MMDRAVKRARHDLQERLNRPGMTYGRLAADLDVNKGVLWKFLNSRYIPTDPELRRRIGIAVPITQFVVRDDLGRFTKEGE